jgi:hypothetical protein
VAAADRSPSINPDLEIATLDLLPGAIPDRLAIDGRLPRDPNRPLELGIGQVSDPLKVRNVDGGGVLRKDGAQGFGSGTHPFHEVQVFIRDNTVLLNNPGKCSYGSGVTDRT